VRVDAVIDGKVAGTGRGRHALPFVWRHGGTSLTLGHARGLPVCDGYRPPFPWTGTVHSVRVDAGAQPLPVEDLIRTVIKAD
jgi:arylsulfatase